MSKINPADAQLYRAAAGLATAVIVKGAGLRLLNYKNFVKKVLDN